MLYKIYVIKSLLSDDSKCYVGSTCQKYLSSRLSSHKKDRSCGSKELFELGKVTIHLIEDYPCNSKKELEDRERIYIEFILKNFDYKIICNKKIPCRTKKESSKEWYIKNKEKQKIYIENNEELKLYRKKLINCECGGQYVISNKTRHFKTNKHIKYVEQL